MKKLKREYAVIILPVILLLLLLTNLYPDKTTTQKSVSETQFEQSISSEVSTISNNNIKTASLPLCIHSSQGVHYQERKNLFLYDVFIILLFFSSAYSWHLYLHKNFIRPLTLFSLRFCFLRC